MGETRERIIQIMMVGDPFGSAANIAGEIDAKDKRIAELEGLLREAETMIKNADVSVNTLTKAGDMLAARLDQALAEIDALTEQLAEARADVHDAGQRNDDMAAILPTWIHATVLLPASGAKVLAWDGKNILRAMYAKRFTEEVRPGGEEEATEYSEGMDGYFLIEGWYEHNEFDEVHWTIENPVTHWMPLPAPPAVKA